MLHKAYWWLKHRFSPKHRYHVHKFHHLKPGWHDVDNKMLHSMFDYLVEYVEEEDGMEVLNYQWKDKDKDFPNFPPERYAEYKRVYEEVKFLYEWWQEYLKTEYDFETLEEEDRKYNEATEMMCRLAKIRAYLWT
jgi:hypothetical protein